MPTFTAERTASTSQDTPATDLQVTVEHQPRERGVRCNTCSTTTFEAQHGVCDHCIDRGYLTTNCRCREGVRAAQVAAQAVTA